TRTGGELARLRVALARDLDGNRLTYGRPLLLFLYFDFGTHDVSDLLSQTSDDLTSVFLANLFARPRLRGMGEEIERNARLIGRFRRGEHLARSDARLRHVCLDLILLEEDLL